MDYYFIVVYNEYEVKPVHLAKLPIKKISWDDQKPFIYLVENILSAKFQNQDTTALEKEIDVLVYKLYELSYEEVLIIDPAFGLAKKDYEALG